MGNRRFKRRLDEALATVGGGVDVPTDIYNDDGGDGEYDPSPEEIKAMYAWVKSAPNSLLSPVVSALENVDPAMHTGGVTITKPAGFGSDTFSGRASLVATWKMDDGDPAFPGMEHTLRTYLAKSDLWKALGVDYNQASRYLDSQSFMTQLMRALAFKLADANHAAYWLHLANGRASDLAARQISDYVSRAGHKVVDGGTDQSVSAKPGSIRVQASKKPSNIMAGSAPMAKVSSDGGFQHDNGFTMSSQLEFSFTGKVDVYDGDTQSAMVRGLRECLDVVWEELSQEFEVNTGGGESDPEWYPESYTTVVADWQELFELELGPEELSAALGGLSPRALHMARSKVDCTDNSDAGRYGMTATAVLAVRSARPVQGGIEIDVSVTDVFTS